MLAALKRFLFARPTVPLLRYCGTAFPLALIPEILLVAFLFLVLWLVGIDPMAIPPPPLRMTFSGFAGAVVFSPVFETLLLAFLINVLSNWIKARLPIAAASALVWGGLHGLYAPIWFFGTVWAFFVFSCGFLVWRERSFGSAFVAAALPHALVNGTVFFVAAWAGKT